MLDSLILLKNKNNSTTLDEQTRLHIDSLGISRNKNNVNFKRRRKRGKRGGRKIREKIKLKFSKNKSAE